MNGTVMTIEITRLKIYPVKSLKGIALDQATLTPQGLLNDRRWMVVRSNGKFVTQRDLPRLAGRTCPPQATSSSRAGRYRQPHRRP